MSSPGHGVRRASARRAFLGALTGALCLAGAGLGGGLVAGTAAASTGAQPGARSRLLTHAMHGTSAVRSLGSDLGTAAQRSGRSAAGLERILTTDSSAWVGQAGELFYVEPDELASPPAGTAQDEPADPTPSATVAPTLAQAFSLHSRASATRKIYLDFDGSNVSGSFWNANSGMPNRDYTGYSLDSDTTSFSSAELTSIAEIWREVSESYSPFDVDVTTQDPGTAGLRRSTSSDTAYGDRVLVTSEESARQTMCGSCAGVALVGTFNAVSNSDYYQPAWVFASATSGLAIPTAQVISHEVGHTLGLSHDGLTESNGTHDEYYGGQGNWQPIMGSGYHALGQWSSGEYAGANNTEDDLAVMVAHGISLRGDDAGDSVLTATDLGAAGGYSRSGVISTRADLDVYRINRTCAGAFSAAATTIGDGAMLDTRIDLLDASGAVLTSNDPTSGETTGYPRHPTGLNASVGLGALGAGTYYLRVDGVGRGNPLTTGYSDYSSLGQYTLTASGCSGSSTSASSTTEPSAPSASSNSGTAATPAVPATPTSIPAATPAAPPGVPGLGSAWGGARGGRSTLGVSWSSPAATASTAVGAYVVRTQRVVRHKGSRHGRIVWRVVAARSTSVRADTLSVTLTRPPGTYLVSVRAVNAAGGSAWSRTSGVVTAR